MSPKWPLLVISVLMGSFTVVGCSSGSSDNLSEPANCEVSGVTAENQNGIVGGRVLELGNYYSSSTVHIIAKAHGQAGICTGTLIAPNIVLTAAHCISPHSTDPAYVAFTNNTSCFVQARKRTGRPVVARMIHPKYIHGWDDDSNSASDLALIQYEGETPAEVRPRPLQQKPNVKGASELIMTGYGKTSERNEDSGVLRITRTPMSRLSRSYYSAHYKVNINLQNTWAVSQPDTGVCNGDSGGPLFANTPNGLVQLGVVSLGISPDPDDRNREKVCHGVSLFADVTSESNWNWIQKSIEELNY